MDGGMLTFSQLGLFIKFPNIHVYIVENHIYSRVDAK